MHNQTHSCGVTSASFPHNTIYIKHLLTSRKNNLDLPYLALKKKPGAMKTAAVLMASTMQDPAQVSNSIKQPKE
jgi:hypothetical protein